MMISTKGRYALRVMLDLASRDDGFMSMKEVAEDQDISMKYLEAIVARLHKSDLVLSHRGKDGGYKLAKPASAITVADILCSAESSLLPVECAGLENTCGRAEGCLTLPLWKALDRRIETYLSTVTLEDVLLGRVEAE